MALAISDSLPAAHPSYEHAVSCVKKSPHSKSFISVVELKDLPEVIRTLRIWKRFIRAEREIIHDKKSKGMASDFSFVAKCFQRHVGKIKEGDTYTILAAVDTDETIQALACFNFYTPPGCATKRFHVEELLTAPWNLPFTAAPVYFSPIKGGGTILMHAMFSIASLNKLRILELASTYTGSGFYRRLGMKQINVNTFVFLLDTAEHNEKMTSAFKRVFGDSFKYTLLMA